MRLLRFLLFLITLSLTAFAQETKVSSNSAHYDGDNIVLTGNVIIEHPMGKVQAEQAILKKDTHKTSNIDFPWAELKGCVFVTLALGGTLECDQVYLDHIKKISTFIGNIIYKDRLGEVFADHAVINYKEENGSLVPIQITLTHNVQLINRGDTEKPGLKWAVADQGTFFPEEQRILLESFEGNRVFFFDEIRNMRLTARAIEAKRDLLTNKDSVQGIGDVHFVFGPEELEKIKKRLSIDLP